MVGEGSGAHGGGLGFAPRDPRHWLALLALWTVPPLLTVAARSAWGGAPPSPLWPSLALQLLLWLPWVGLTPPILALAARFPPRRPGVVRGVLVHAAASAAAGLLHTLWVAGFELGRAGLLPMPPVAFVGLVLRAGRGSILLSAAVYWLVVGVVWGVVAYQRAREREALLTEARLVALTAQVRPHFLFNTLHAISTLIEEDPSAAQRMLARLGELLRASLRAGNGAERVALSEELELARLYLDIERVRFADRLRVEIEIGEDAGSVRVPHLLLQPLVENAIRHGIGRDSRAGEVRLRAEVSGGRLRILVEDDGPGPGPAAGGGLGLRNTAARLRELYGPDASLELRSRAPRGAVAEVVMPAERGVEGGRQ